MKLNPNIEIKQTSIERNENYYPQLLTHLGTGSGLADIQAVEVGNIAEITATQADKLVDLGKAPGVRQGRVPGLEVGSRAPPRTARPIGLGTDIGPQGICYRKDLFDKAGLPTDREAVGQAVGGRLEQVPGGGQGSTRRRRPRAPPSWTPPSGVMAAVTGSESENASTTRTARSSTRPTRP